MRVDQSVNYFEDKIYCKIAIGGDGAVGKTTLFQPGDAYACEPFSNQKYSPK